MFRRKLTALDHPDAASFSISDDKKFRELVIWLEDQKIRQYKIEDREKLRRSGSPDWIEAFGKYLKDVYCPYTATHNRDVLADWLLGYAVRLEYGDHVNELKDKTAAMLIDEIAQKRKNVSDNPLDKLDFNDPSFKSGVDELAKELNIPKHPDHLVTLEACCRLIKERLASCEQDGKGCGQDSKKKPQGPMMQLEKYPLGFGTGDHVLDNAARVLRLLHVRELRDLQTRINQIIVQVQNVTADPKVDERLGKIGSG